MLSTTNRGKSKLESLPDSDRVACKPDPAAGQSDGGDSVAAFSMGFEIGTVIGGLP